MATNATKFTVCCDGCGLAVELKRAPEGKTVADFNANLAAALRRRRLLRTIKGYFCSRCQRNGG